MDHRYPQPGFTEANAAYQVALELQTGDPAGAGRRRTHPPTSTSSSTTVTGAAVPTVEARLAAELGMRPDVSGSRCSGGCVAGAAGVARMNDYLRAYPDHVAVLLAVELCSLTIQRDDHSIANLVATSLFRGRRGGGGRRRCAACPGRPRRPRCWRAAGSTPTPPR